MRSPTFRTYLRVIRRRPGFWITVASWACFSLAVWLRSGLVHMLVVLAITLGLMLAAFLWWRHQAIKNPEAYTWGQPELLAEDRPAHPAEPISNVTRIE